MIKKFNANGLQMIEVENNVGLNIKFCSLGAAIFEIKFLDEFMTSNPKNLEDFSKPNIYHGKTIGRVAGRIRGNKIVIDDKTYSLESNENGNVLHGGNDAFSNKVFTSKVYSDSNNTHVVYSYSSPNGESGFPGNADIEVHYLIANNESSLIVEFNCKVSEKCPISLTNHSYFCLGEASINNLHFQVDASKFILMNTYDLTLEKEAPLPSYLDFRKSKSLIKDIDAKEINEGKLCGYDHILLFDKNKDIILENKRFKLNISTDLDSVVFYTDNYDSGFETNNSKCKIRRGVAIEPQLNPLKNRILNPGKEFKHYITYNFQIK